MLRRAWVMACISVALFTSQCVSASAMVSVSAPHTSVSLDQVMAGKQFLFQGLPISGLRNTKGQTVKIHGVQTFAYTPDGKYVFTTSQCETGLDGRYNTLLSRCTLPKSGGRYATCNVNTILDTYGHGESITITQRDKKKEVYDIWVACSEENGMGTEIARLTYKVGGSRDTITKRVVLRNFEKANVVNGTGTDFTDLTGVLKVRRMGVYADESSNQILFRINFESTGKRSNYVIYDLKALNALLDKYGSDRKFSMKNAAHLQKANIRTALCPLETYQACAIDGRYLYISGGHKEIGGQIYKIPYKISKNGASSVVNVTEPETVIDIAPEPVTKDNGGLWDLEIEGLQVTRNGKKTDYYVNYYYIGADLADKVYVYKFTV